MPLRNFVLVLHILGAIFGFGPAMVFSIVVPAAAQKNSGASPALMGMLHKLDWRLFFPIDIIQPLTGAWLILITNDAWDPFEKRNRWLLGSIVIYIGMMAIIYGMVMPMMRRTMPIIEREGFSPAVQQAMARMRFLGPALGASLLTIIVLMVTKPGSGFIHP